MPAAFSAFSAFATTVLAVAMAFTVPVALATLSAAFGTAFATLTAFTAAFATLSTSSLFLNSCGFRRRLAEIAGSVLDTAHGIESRAVPAERIGKAGKGHCQNENQGIHAARHVQTFPKTFPTVRKGY